MSINAQCKIDGGVKVSNILRASTILKYPAVHFDPGRAQTVRKSIRTELNFSHLKQVRY